ncbi:MAG: NPCBM/NEW2 domain-containing protein, partial [Planctomycetes bacterium]|nr:NPCBM/NEW2 domain-containing protein [Planctomycetota bacterium]
EGTKFVAAAGLGNRDDRSSVVFKVLVDGKAKYTSDTFHSGDGIIPVIVDVTGAEKMTLVTLPTDDGIGYDYAWWGDARLIKE